MLYSNDKKYYLVNIKVEEKLEYKNTQSANVWCNQPITIKISMILRSK